MCIVILLIENEDSMALCLRNVQKKKTSNNITVYK